MKAAALIAILAASLATAEVTWTFQKFENGTEVPFTAGPLTSATASTGARLPPRSHRPTGAVPPSPAPGFTSVTGTWTIPTISLRSGQSSSSDPAISQWVGIDGFSDSALIQGGTLSQLVGGRQENVAWTEMLPAASRDVSLTVDTGDSITTTVTMTSATSGSVTITNNSRGTSIVGTVSGGTRLSATSAEWILEDFESGSSLVSFAAFPTSTFTGSATRSGTSVSPSGATLIDLVQNSELCSATLSGTTVTVRDS
ncbi:Acid proteinase A [Mycena venus]|uniref:Acid proteinase A n=1 Tax=Mycena venus TaxID=2733690 RepID=A0A8H7CF98_9AGAR|nr:Acid proteinase A [Mycena venus]